MVTKAALIKICFYVSVLSAVANSSAENTGTMVIFETSLGKLVLEVNEAKAPAAAAYFLGFVDRGDYDNATFYRAASLDGESSVQLIQGGILLDALNRDESDGIESFQFPVLQQFETTDETGLSHTYATLSLARDLLDTGHVIPEFVICFRDIPTMDYAGRKLPDERGFPAFGKVVSGMDVAWEIARSDLGGSTNIEFLKGQILSEPILISRAYRLPMSVQ